MIRRAAPPLSPDDAARGVAAGRDPVWLTSPGSASDTAIEFDMVACDPTEVLRGRSIDALEEAWGRARQAWEEPSEHELPTSLPVAVGWLSYDLARQWISLPSRRSVDPQLLPQVRRDAWPEIEFRFFDAVWIRQNASPEAWIWAQNAAAGERLMGQLQQEPGARGGGGERRSPLVNRALGSVLGPLRDETPRATYLAAVERVKEYLRAGDAYQVNLSRRLMATVEVTDPVGLASSLRATAPAPHAVWMGSRSTPRGPLDRFVVGNSPERFLRTDRARRVETRPIKGTRARAVERVANDAARSTLRSSSKDRAEHVMIVDLERNDLGRVAEPGSVVCEGLLRAVEFSTVHHLVSTIRARLRPHVGLRELLEATFPGGSITGAPKRRAMEIIDELEGRDRGLYTGATGWLGAGGEMDLAIAIRTAIVDRGLLSLSVGGGIVIDSVAEDEWAETEAKARAFLDLGARGWSR